MRILFFLQPGTNSRSIFRDMIRGFEQAGHEAFTLHLGPLWEMFEKDPQSRPRKAADATAAVRSFIAQNRIDATAAMWANAPRTFTNVLQRGRPATLFDAIGVPHLLIWLDAPHWAHGGDAQDLFRSPLMAGPALLHLINNAATAREMTEVLGFGRTVVEPYGINEEIFRPHPDERREYDLVVSCGPGDPAPTPQALQELDSDQPDMNALRGQAMDALRPGLARIADAFPQSGAVRELLTRLLASQRRDRHTPMLTRLRSLATDPAITAAAASLLDRPKAYIAATMLIRQVDAFERAFTISYLSRRFRTAVFGQFNHEQWGSRATDLGNIAYEDMSRAYSRGAVGLNVMRSQDDEGLNLKPYEITASGTACLCARRAGLESSFVPGREIVVFDTPDQAAAELRALLDNPERQRELAAAGSARTRSFHTWTHRARGLADHLHRLRTALGPKGSEAALQPA
jgi:spore maturation protein CgeB